MTRPKRNTPRVFRGGSWVNSDPAWVRASFRVTYAPTIRYNNLGFRTALPARMKR